MVIARRMPAARHGHGKAARYVSGRMPINSRRMETKTGSRGDQSANVLAAMNNAKTEQEKIEAMFAAEGNTWKEQQQQMAQYVTLICVAKTVAKIIVAPNQCSSKANSNNNDRRSPINHSRQDISVTGVSRRVTGYTTVLLMTIQILYLNQS
jgi:hypothetical protein